MEVYHYTTKELAEKIQDSGIIKYSVQARYGPGTCDCEFDRLMLTEGQTDCILNSAHANETFYVASV